MNKAPYYPALIVAAIEKFAQQMQQSTQLEDGVLTARVVGEFSAGKTRLLKELLSSTMPDDLFPVSSIERQTKLQLEISYGEQAELTLIERENDYDAAKVIKKLTRFPLRDDIDSSMYSPEKHRLQLSVPEPHFILPTGDGFSDKKVPMRLFLIDTPGWNSGEDDIAEREASQILTGYHNLGLVYVSDARRLDGKTNKEHLSDFLEVLQGADFLGKAHLVFVVTHCPEADQLRFQQRTAQQVKELWQSLGHDEDELNLHVLCVDFEELNPVQRQQFKAQFWQHLLEPLGDTKPQTDPWTLQIQHWPSEWDIRPKLAASYQALQSAKALLARCVINGEFVKSMNMSRLMGLNETQMRQQVTAKWLKQVEANSLEEIAIVFKFSVMLPKEHPLANWWQQYWHAKMIEILAASQAFLMAFEKALNTLKPQTTDLQQHFSAYLAPLYQQAVDAFDSSFTCLVDTAQALSKETATEKVLATLLTLSLLEGRYTEHYHKAKQGAIA